jgi:hypothetical protein
VLGIIVEAVTAVRWLFYLKGSAYCCEDKLSIETILNSDDTLRAKQKERCSLYQRKSEPHKNAG